MKNNYGIFYSGLASTPMTIGLKNWATGEVVCEISCDRPTGKATREAYEKYKAILQRAYQPLLANQNTNP